MRIFFLSFFLFPYCSLALKVQARVDRENLTINETLIFTVDIQSEKNLDDVDISDLSVFKYFHILGEWSNRESSIQIINGQMEKNNILSKNYRLQAKRIGTLRIEPLAVKVDGNLFKTDAFIVNVSEKNRNPTPAPPSLPSQPFSKKNPFQLPGSLFNIFSDPFFHQDKAGDGLKVQLQLNKRTVYKTEMLRADWFILQSSGSIRYELYKLPDLKRFWKEEIKNKKPGSFVGTQVVDKVLYRKQLLNSLWLFPLRSGSLTVDSYSIKASSLISFHSRNKILSSLPKKITVKDLPVAGQGVFFTGAVGFFTVQADIPEKSAVLNQPLSYKIVFEGSGHPRFINLPDIPFPPSVQAYPPVEKSHFFDRGWGKKEFEILLIPKTTGALDIPSWTVSTFDPKSKKYVSHKIPSFSLFVKEGESIKEQSEEVFSFDSLPVFYWPSFINHKNFVNFFLILFGLLAVVLCFFYIKNYKFKKNISVRKEIDKKFTAIQKLLDKKEWQKACTQMIHTNEYLLQSVQIKSFPSGWRQALDNLPPRLSGRYAEQFKDIFKSLESLSFSLESSSEEEALNKTKYLFIQTKNLVKSFFSDL